MPKIQLFSKKLLTSPEKGVIIRPENRERAQNKKMFGIYDEAKADMWEEIQAEMAYWEAEEAQYTEDRKNFLEAMDIFYHGEE